MECEGSAALRIVPRKKAEVEFLALRAVDCCASWMQFKGKVWSIKFGTSCFTLFGLRSHGTVKLAAGNGTTRAAPCVIYGSRGGRTA